MLPFVKLLPYADCNNLFLVPISHVLLQPLPIKRPEFARLGSCCALWCCTNSGHCLLSMTPQGRPVCGQRSLCSDCQAEGGSEPACQFLLFSCLQGFNVHHC